MKMFGGQLPKASFSYTEALQSELRKSTESCSEV